MRRLYYALLRVDTLDVRPNGSLALQQVNISVEDFFKLVREPSPVFRGMQREGEGVGEVTGEGAGAGEGTGVGETMGAGVGEGTGEGAGPGSETEPLAGSGAREGIGDGAGVVTETAWSLWQALSAGGLDSFTDSRDVPIQQQQLQKCYEPVVMNTSNEQSMNIPCTCTQSERSENGQMLYIYILRVSKGYSIINLFVKI